MTSVLLHEFDSIVQQVGAPNRPETVRALWHDVGHLLAPILLLPGLRSRAVAS